MGIITSESFDGVTVPALPSGWVASADISTQASVSNSSPNALQNTVDSTTKFAYYDGADDGNGGDAQASFVLIPVTIGTVVRAAYSLVRMTAPSTTVAGMTSYFTFVNTVSGLVTLGKFVSGSITNFSSITSGAIAGLAFNIRPYCIAIGTTITARIQRLSDGNWLDSAGVWQPTVQDHIAHTDASISGVGKAGIGMQRGDSSDLHFIDDFVFETAPVVTATRRRASASFI